MKYGKELNEEKRNKGMRDTLFVCERFLGGHGDNLEQVVR